MLLSRCLGVGTGLMSLLSVERGLRLVGLCWLQNLCPWFVRARSQSDGDGAVSLSLV